jgi:hypothetical protein
VFSFMGLGAVLLVLAYFYRRLGFAGDPPRATTAGAAPDGPA